MIVNVEILFVAFIQYIYTIQINSSTTSFLNALGLIWIFKNHINFEMLLVHFDRWSLYPVSVLLCLWEFVPPPEWITFLLRHKSSRYITAAYSWSLSFFLHVKPQTIIMAWLILTLFLSHFRSLSHVKPQTNWIF